MNIMTRINRVFPHLFSLIGMAIFSLNLAAQAPMSSTTAGLGLDQEAFFQDFSTFIPKDSPCKFKIDARHQSIPCLQKMDLNLLAEPEVMSDCGAIATMAYTDEYLDLGCTENGFSGYFVSSRWEALKIKGDGGVDVTGALNSILVEGANTALVSAMPGEAIQLQIVVPAEGYIAFDWENIGGSNIFSYVAVAINNTYEELTASVSSNGSFFSNFVKTGDVFAIQLNAPQSTAQLKLSNFRFMTNAVGVTKRHWEVQDVMGNAKEFVQLITIDRATLADVVFPNNLDGAESLELINEAYQKPIYTGFPVIDTDGNPNTTADQLRLDENDCTFHVEWTDNFSAIEDGQIIHRLWTITDYCSGSIMKETQVIKLVNTFSPKVIPERYEFDVKQSRIHGASELLASGTEED